VNLTLQGIAITECSAPVPPLLVTSPASLHLVDFHFNNNSNTGVMAAGQTREGSGDGGGVQCVGCQRLLLEGVSATSNTASGSGGVVHIQDSPGGLIIKNSHFVHNAATTSGGSIRAIDADVAVEDSLFDRSHVS